MVNLKKTNDYLKQTIENYEEVNKDTPGLFAYREVNAEGIIKKLSLIEDSPKRVWNALEQFYGHSFFLDVIKEKFGLIPKVNSKFEREFNEKLMKYQQEATDQINKLIDRYYNELSTMRDDLQKKNETIDEMITNHSHELEKVKTETEEAFNSKIKDKENAVKMLCEYEIEGLKRKIKELESLIRELSNNKLLSKLRVKVAVILIII